MLSCDSGKCDHLRNRGRNIFGGPWDPHIWSEQEQGLHAAACPCDSWWLGRKEVWRTQMPTPRLQHAFTTVFLLHDIYQKTVPTYPDAAEDDLHGVIWVYDKTSHANALLAWNRPQCIPKKSVMQDLWNTTAPAWYSSVHCLHRQVNRLGRYWKPATLTNIQSLQYIGSTSHNSVYRKYYRKRWHSSTDMKEFLKKWTVEAHVSLAPYPQSNKLLQKLQ